MAGLKAWSRELAYYLLCTLDSLTRFMSRNHKETLTTVTTFCTCYSSNSSNLRVAAFVYKPRREISFCSSAYIVSLIRQESMSWKICFMRNSPTKLYLTSCPTYPEIWSEFQNLDHKLLLFCFEEKSVPFKLPPFTCQVLMLVDVNR